MLVGREDVLEVIERKLQDSHLLVLDGDSGSGKTSLLQNGLRGQLERIGFEVFVCRSWPAMTDKSDVDSYILSGLAEERDNPSVSEIENAIGAARTSAFFASRLCEALDNAYDGNAVLVLDQFEELLRQHRDDARRVMAWIRDVVETYDVRILLSLRSDTVHLLDPHLKGISAYLLDRETVTSFTDDELVELIINERKTDARLPAVAVDEELSTLIRTAWRAHAEPRLLGLQALLWSLYVQARNDAHIDPMDRAGVAEIRLTAETLARVVGNAPDIFEAGLLASVAFDIGHAEAATAAGQLDPYLLNGTKELVRRATPFLWSAGFKVPAVESELVGQVLEPELRVLTFTGKDGAAAARCAKWVAEMLGSGDLLRFNTPALGLAGGPVAFAPNATSGPLLGRPAEVALVEECRRVAFAVEWLCATNIAKRKDGVLTLVHDGSGVALKEWSRQTQPGIEFQIHRLTAARGEQFDFGRIGPAENVAWRLASPYEEYTVLPNLNWRDCRITGDFAQVVFLNCDFSGATFATCSFSGVTFVNCLLDDADLEACTFHGAPGAVGRSREHAAGKVRIAPSFEIHVDPEMAKAFAAYFPHGEVQSDAAFFSDLAGAPALPGGRPTDHVGETVDFQPGAGGVALIGGRISFLTLHGCGKAPKSEGDAAAELHYVAGGGLDIVEPLDTTVTLHDCALRGISVTRDQGEGDGDRADAGHVQLEASDSFLVFVYMSGGLQGAARFTGSTLWSIVNASHKPDGDESSSLVLSLIDSRHQFVVNADLIDEATAIEDSIATQPAPYFYLQPGYVSVFRSHAEPDLAAQLAFMDYRRDPESRERRQRQRWATSQNETDDTRSAR